MRSLTLQVQTYRQHRIEVKDDRGNGWIIRIYPPTNEDIPRTLINRVPNGLSVLLEEAHTIIDRRSGQHAVSW